MSEPKYDKRLVRFLHEDCVVQYAEYEENGRPAILLLCSGQGEAGHECGVRGERMSVATVNLHNQPLPAGHAFIKDYSENEGMGDALMKAGIVVFTGRHVPTGHVWVAEAQLTPDYCDEPPFPV